MRAFYLDLAKICFGVGFYGSLVKLETPLLTVTIGVLSLIMAGGFAWVAYTQPERNV